MATRSARCRSATPKRACIAASAPFLPRQIFCDLPAIGSRDARPWTRPSRDTRHELAAVIVEPLVQGAGGMRMHPPDVLATVARLARRHGLPLIVDEIFTGFGRTGTLFACEQAGIVPDILCLSKALTGGTMALAATVASREVFSAFLVGRCRGRADARADLHGEPARLRGGQCQSRPVRAGAAPGPGRRDRPRASREGLEPLRRQPSVADVRTLGAIGVVQFARLGDLAALKAPFPRTRRLGASLRRHRLPDAGPDHRAGRPRPADRCGVAGRREQGGGRLTAPAASPVRAATGTVLCRWTSWVKVRREAPPEDASGSRRGRCTS